MNVEFNEKFDKQNCIGHEHVGQNTRYMSSLSCFIKKASMAVCVSYSLCRPVAKRPGIETSKGDANRLGSLQNT